MAARDRNPLGMSIRCRVRCHRQRAAVVPGSFGTDADPSRFAPSDYARKLHCGADADGCRQRQAHAGTDACRCRCQGRCASIGQQAAGAGAGRWRNAARAKLGLEWLCAPDHAAAGAHRTDQFHRCHCLRNQHRSLAAVHVLGVRPRQVRQRPDCRLRVAAACAGPCRYPHRVARQPIGLQGRVRRAAVCVVPARQRRSCLSR